MPRLTIASYLISTLPTFFLGFGHTPLVVALRNDCTLFLGLGPPLQKCKSADEACNSFLIKGTIHHGMCCVLCGTFTCSLISHRLEDISQNIFKMRFYWNVATTLYLLKIWNWAQNQHMVNRTYSATLVSNAFHLGHWHAVFANPWP